MINRCVLCGCFWALCITGTHFANAETYRDIGPLDTLAEVKAKLPNAKFEQRKPAWAQESDVLYAVSGLGLSGTIIIKFDDSRPYFRQILEKNPEDAFSREIVNTPDEKALDVGWVRWIPDSPIPLQRFVAKYGKPDTRGFSDEDLQPYRLWKSGLTVYLSDDEKLGVRVDFNFTDDEIRRAYLARYGFVPESLQDSEKETKAISPPPSKVKPKPKGSSKKPKKGSG